MQHPDPVQSPEDIHPDVLGALLCAGRSLAEIAEASSALLKAARSVSDALDHLARLDTSIEDCGQEEAGEDAYALDIAGLAVSVSASGELSIEKGPGGSSGRSRGGRA
tara:strand:- start:100 stop:423 length:324 start_codon:yes stop_codon:yes gene_type:complete